MSEEHRTLDAQRRRLAELEGAVDDLLAGRPGPVLTAPAAVTSSYREVVGRNEALRSERSWDGLAPPTVVAPRRPWAADDKVVAGLAGAVGFAAAWFDAPVECWVRDRLKNLGGSDLLRQWEADARRLPIDHMGPGFGGAGHRVRSAGHDLLRPVAALRQIRRGEFEGNVWENGRRYLRRVGGYRPVDSTSEALALWLKHLAADVVTDRSLPLPGWTWLYECRGHEFRRAVQTTYEGSRGEPGLTVRTGLLQSLPVLSTEVIVRGHVHGRALHERGTVVLTAEERALRDEMLLVAHGLVGAASLGRTLATALTGSGPLALRHVNAQVLLRVGTLGWTVAGHRAERVPEWTDLLERLEAPWGLELAAEIDVAAENT